MRIAVLRHGQTDWNIQRKFQVWQGLDLNEAGRQQARGAAEALTATATQLGIGWAWLASSSSTRAVSTARIVGEGLGLTPTATSDDLIEMGFGAAEGMGIIEARERWPDHKFPGGESADMVLARALRGINTLAAAHADSDEGTDGVIVTHGTVLRLLVAEISGIDPGSLPNAAFAVLRGSPGDWTVEVSPGASETYAKWY
jgi:broad specificity phosphatase PhoE